ncbi:MAG: aminotransferase class V-fold PLP-dependent enzyme [Propionibacteriales bacterium]|nr:aminotransferase class V-fold PLP-dependent enzyme [Propionibacteriales bacterium]
MRSGQIYLDYNGTTPVDPRVVDAMLPYLREHFGNPSSTHHYGQEPRHALARARDQLAGLVGGTADEITFTASGSEADALAIRGAVLAGRLDGAHIITQDTEHPAVLETCRSLQRLHGVDVTYLPVDQHGRVDPQAVADAITARTTLVSIMFANNETGTLQPVREIAEVAHRHGVLVHTDAAQGLGKMPVDVRRLGVDLLTVVGHKMYAPKGIGALWVRTGGRLEPIAYGGGQERDLRAGTENVALAVALGAAAELSAADLTTGEADRLRGLRDELSHRLADRLPGRVRLNGHPTERLPNTVNFTIASPAGDQLLAAIPGIAASTGSACHAGSTEPSPVLAAMARDPSSTAHEGDRVPSAIRFSLGRWTTADDISRAATLIAEGATVTRQDSRPSDGLAPATPSGP